ncbi:hypothetical protein TIFTF001_021019 [Ficus carica]|uniref:Uncharacterized protein n=1 Tax=Ficus carica TaxID=3494 RepID=A0AA88AGR2_FICCA|nr:hypothetical protein TIFTF001_021019 [Ficus carica]
MQPPSRGAPAEIPQLVDVLKSVLCSSQISVSIPSSIPHYIASLPHKYR